GLPGGFFVEATYLPPVTIAHATPNMASLALGVVRQLGTRAGLALRAATTIGPARGPITCPDDALQHNDTEKACYGDAPSKDTYHPNIMAIESAITWNASDRVRG